MTDIFKTEAIGLIIDFSNWVIYKSKYDKTILLQNELKMDIEKGSESYLFRSDGYYKAEIKQDRSISYVKISETEIPLKIREVVNREIAYRKLDLNIN